jgi:hypothetical protein
MKFKVAATTIRLARATATIKRPGSPGLRIDPRCRTGLSGRCRLARGVSSKLRPAPASGALGIRRWAKAGSSPAT